MCSLIFKFDACAFPESNVQVTDYPQPLWIEFKHRNQFAIMPMKVESRNVTADVPKGKKTVSITITEISWDDGKVEEKFTRNFWVNREMREKFCVYNLILDEF